MGKLDLQCFLMGWTATSFITMSLILRFHQIGCQEWENLKLIKHVYVSTYFYGYKSRSIETSFFDGTVAILTLPFPWLMMLVTEHITKSINWKYPSMRLMVDKNWSLSEIYLLKKNNELFDKSNTDNWKQTVNLLNHWK